MESAGARACAAVIALSLCALGGCARAHERPRRQTPVVRPMDLNGDGFSDLAVGSQGAVYVYLGGPSGVGLEPSAEISGVPGASIEFGDFCVCAGDLDGDGLSDLAIFDGALISIGDTGEPLSWGWLVVPGAAEGVDVSRARWLPPSAIGLTHGFFGLSAVGPGDFDRDGLDDLLILSSSDHVRQLDMFPGAADFFSADTVRGRVLGTVPGPGLLVRLGDVDGDGRADIGVAMLGTDVGAGAEPNRVVVFTSDDAMSFRRFEPPSTTSGFGSRVAPAGDVDGDGLDDLVVSTQTGAFIARGGRELGASIGALEPPADATEQFGQRLAGGGDLDGDGALDVVVSMPGFARPMGEGAIEIYWGGMGSAVPFVGLSTMAAGPSAMDMNGDLNGDGRSELVLSHGPSQAVEILTWDETMGTPRVVQLPALGAGFGLWITTGQ